MAGLLVLLSSYSSYSEAQTSPTQTTPNLVQQYGWQGCLTQHPGWIWGGSYGGPCPVQRAGDGAILFSYGLNTLSQTIAVNQALSGTGIQIRGYDYSWTIKNANAGAGQNPAFDPLSITVDMTSPTNQVLESRSYDYTRRINDWTTFSGTENFANPYALSAVGNLNISIRSIDSGYWAGYYGPEINNISLRLRYGVDQCVANPLSNPECPGYQEAFFQQQCSANPLYNAACPGYAAAYFTQQCTANPLSNPACPGYQAAFFQQQCSANPLTSPECPGYATALFEKTCSENPLSNQQCSGYAQAYFNQQCTANPLYNTQCPGYQSAYQAQQCQISPLWSSSCPGYEAAYLAQQCSQNQLYSPQCPGYQAALFIKTCSENPLSSTQCAGYQTAYFNQQCGISALFSPQCPGYAAAYQAQQCGINPLYNTACPGYGAAFLAQQCSQNQLYSPECPLYAEARRQQLQSQACSANPQSSTTCAGYRVPVAETTVTATVGTPTVIAVPQTSGTTSTDASAPAASNPANPVAAAAQTSSQPSTTPLGTGISVPGFNRFEAPRNTSRSSITPNARTTAINTARAAEQRAQEVARGNAMAAEQSAQLATMGTVPGFDAYTNATIPDAGFYAPRGIYERQRVVDNVRAQRALTGRSDRIHEEMINEQYRR